MNHQPNDIDFNDPKIQKAFAFFQQQQQQQQMQQMMLQQQTQLMMQQQFMMQQQWNEFLQFCQISGLNSNDPNALNQFYQMKMNMNNMNNVNNPMGMGNMNNQMGMNNININNQQPINKSTNLNQSTVYINSEVQPPRGDNVYLTDQLGNNNNNNNGQTKETIPRMNKTVYVNENELNGNNGFNMNQNQNNFMKFGMSSSTDIVNITLNATSGLKVVIPAQKSMPLCQLFKNYVKKVGVPESVIGTKIVFLFNAEKLDTNSTQPISYFFKNFNANITVLDQANIIGA